MRPDALADLEARVVEVQVVLDPAQGVVGDAPGVAEVDDRPPLALEEVVAQALVGDESSSRSSRPSPSSRAAKRSQAEAVELAQAAQRALRDAGVVPELVEVLERRPGGRHAGLVLLALDLVAGALGGDPPQQPRQRQPLPHHRDDDHDVGQEDDEVAARQRIARVGRQRDGQGGGDRHRPAHPGEGDEQDLDPGRPVGAPEPRAQEPRERPDRRTSRRSAPRRPWPRPRPRRGRACRAPRRRCAGRPSAGCSPTSTKIAASTAKTTTSQVAKDCRRVAGATSSGERQPRTTPQVTAASTAETPAASAGR